VDSKLSDRQAIVGVEVLPLRQIIDERGAVLHMMRADSPLFRRFGEVYFSFVNQGIVKGWKRHRETTQHFAVPVGRIHLVLFDDRAGSVSRGNLQEFDSGRPDDYCLVTIPPQVWYGFKGISDTPAMIANITDLPHDPGESETVDAIGGPVPYRWE
jgi:dTDP-4-dehydrorhamnose 3,5-epimerase